VGIDDGSRTRPPSKPTMTTFAQDKWTQNPSNRKPFDPLGQGRFPANLIVSGEEVMGLFPETGCSARPHSVGNVYTENRTVYGRSDPRVHYSLHSDSGSASRFFFNFSEQESDE